jgi:DNA modification methylase
MAVRHQTIAENWALYNGDCVEVMESLPDGKVDLSLYSPPFCGLYNYSSDERDLSNCRSYEEFFRHYEFVVKEIYRLTKPGRVTAVHCIDLPRAGANAGAGLVDFTGDIIRLHERLGFRYSARYHIWKEPFMVRLRTMAKGLAHRTLTEDSVQCDPAAADYMVVFRKEGENPVPVVHPNGLMRYAGARPIPAEVLRYRGYEGKQTENKYSHWIWRQYASAFWDDIRVDRVLPYEESREPDDERHVHPLQLDVIERACVLWSNPGEVVLTPFAGVGSECYGAVINGRKALGIELKASYYKQAVRNLEAAREDANTELLPFEVNPQGS